MSEITPTEALKVLYKHGSFLEGRTTGYGTTYHCSECGYYEIGCSGDPAEHKPDCKLGQALKLAESLVDADKEAAEALNTKCRFGSLTTSPCPDEATHVSDTGYKSCEKHAPRDRDGKIESRVRLLKPL